jgi:anti-sigma factor RsiW
MAKHHDIELMQHADGELPARTDLAKLVEDDEAARAKAGSIAEIGELVRGHLELSADAVPDARFARMWREIDTGLEAAPRGVWARIASWLDRHRGHLITGAVSAGAVATLALVLRPTAPETTQASGRSSIEVLPAAMRTAPVVESLDTPDGTGTVMNFEDEDGHTTVIWVTPADTVEGI